MMPTLIHVVGARPNFMKVAPVMRAASALPGLRQYLVHTGQHYDASMSDRFFQDLGLPEPDANLGVGSGTHAVQTGRIMIEFEPVVDRLRPDWIVVYGDVNSTMACTLVGVKKGIRVAHVEAGLRSRDRAMPEEINRIVTDVVADLLFTPSRDADENLRAEGVPEDRIRFAGNVMVDTLLALREKARALNIPSAMGLREAGYAFCTFHRPSNVDDPATLAAVLGGIADLAGHMPVVFPIHPRTRQRIAEFGLDELVRGVKLCDPLGYLDTISLLEKSALVLTDSGGLQEETTVLGVPCLTARPSTERPVTITEGTNRLVPSTRAGINEAVAAVLKVRANGGYAPSRPEGWDGRAGERIAAVLASA
jgi:UDP-N-acetylglucosamine 2-epimerase (non-hydrolysing)